jgi:hypothetical protein
MIPFASPEIQFDLIREHTEELVREAAEDRRARQIAERPARRFGRWPRGRRADRDLGAVRQSPV